MDGQGRGSRSAARTQQRQNSPRRLGLSFFAGGKAAAQPIQGFGNLVIGNRLGQIFATSGAHRLQNERGVSLRRNCDQAAQTVQRLLHAVGGFDGGSPVAIEVDNTNRNLRPLQLL